MAITVTLNILLKAILCISIFDARHIKPSEKVCLFFGKSFMMFFDWFVRSCIEQLARNNSIARAILLLLYVL